MHSYSTVPNTKASLADQEQLNSDDQSLSNPLAISFKHPSSSEDYGLPISKQNYLTNDPSSIQMSHCANFVAKPSKQYQIAIQISPKIGKNQVKNTSNVKRKSIGAVPEKLFASKMLIQEA